jgi:hypothetical protein
VYSPSDRFFFSLPQVFSRQDDCDKSLQELGLTKSALLVIQDNEA